MARFKNYNRTRQLPRQNRQRRGSNRLICGMGIVPGWMGRTQRRLFRGDVPIDRRLDLHGHTVARAQVKLQFFIEDAAYSGCRCVLVITGKGSGILQSHVPDWLKCPPLSALVLALAEARQTDGGSGAFYVLLRRRR